MPLVAVISFYYTKPLYREKSLQTKTRQVKRRKNFPFCYNQSTVNLFRCHTHRGLVPQSIEWQATRRTVGVWYPVDEGHLSFGTSCRLLQCMGVGLPTGKRRPAHTCKADVRNNVCGVYTSTLPHIFWNCYSLINGIYLCLISRKYVTISCLQTFPRIPVDAK
jgi:hypothetical protein